MSRSFTTATEALSKISGSVVTSIRCPAVDLGLMPSTLTVLLVLRTLQFCPSQAAGGHGDSAQQRMQAKHHTN